MKASKFIQKCNACLLLTVILYMHLCSSLCAIGVGECAGMTEASHKRMSCCSHENKSTNKQNDCQNLHLRFFNVTGQFSSDNTHYELNKVQPLIGLIKPVLIFQTVLESENYFPYTGFHPPPIKTDLYIFNQSFLI